jgi:hypothetical protein
MLEVTTKSLISVSVKSISKTTLITMKEEKPAIVNKQVRLKNRCSTVNLWSAPVKAEYMDCRERFLIAADFWFSQKDSS